jgi:uncharacterized protein YegP (UPF0339 family)
VRYRGRVLAEGDDQVRFKLSSAVTGETYFEIQVTDPHVETLATSDTYATVADARAIIDRIKRDALAAEVVDESQPPGE